MIDRITQSDALLLIVDMQEKLVRAVQRPDELTSAVHKVATLFTALEMPVIFSEQYPKGLGPTVESLRPFMRQDAVFEKMSFSCCGSVQFMAFLEKIGRKSIVICGVEAHVCVMQTALDLKERGFTPFLMQDAVSSQRGADEEAALKRCLAQGVLPTTVESAVFEIIGSAATPAFKIYRSVNGTLQ